MARVDCFFVTAFTAVSLTLIAISVNGNTVITSPEVTNWGVWGNFDRCPDGKLASVVQLKTHRYMGPLNDDTSLNGIRFYCGDHWDSQTPKITSSEGSKGSWGYHYACGGDGYIFGFQLRVEKKTVLGDNTATNNGRFFCSNHHSGNYIIGDGERFGDWGESLSCPEGHGVCGIRTQVQPYKTFIDNTSLNNVALECCAVEEISKYGKNRRKRFISPLVNL